MISRHLPATLRPLPFCALCFALALPLSAQAGELMPFEIPAEEVQWDQIELDEFSANLPTLEVEPVVPVDTGPDWPAPLIDAYLDTSLSQADFGELNYTDSPSGYRFIAGFRLDTPRLGNWSAAAEFGYVRIGHATRENSFPIDITNPRYQVTQTDTYDTDLSALDFGTRIGYRFFPRIEVYGRGGMQFYHVADKIQTRLDFVAKQGSPDKLPDNKQPSSAADAKANLFGSLGVAFKLGAVPSLYVEYGTRSMGGKLINAGNVGVTMNF